MAKIVDMGMHRARDFWNLIVAPNLAAFYRSRQLLEACNAATSVWHVHDWVFVERRNAGGMKDKRKFQAEIFVACGDLAILRDISDGGKHWALDRPDVGVDELHRRFLGAIASSPAGSLPSGGSNEIIVSYKGQTLALSHVFMRAESYCRFRHDPTTYSEMIATT